MQMKSKNPMKAELQQNIFYKAKHMLHEAYLNATMKKPEEINLDTVRT